MSQPVPCKLEPPGGEHDPTVVLWGARTPDPLRIAVDPVVPRREIEASLFELDEAPRTDRPTALPNAHVKWHRVSTRSAVLALYDAMNSHGILVRPTRKHALAGWDDMHAGIVAGAAPSADGAGDPPGRVGALAPVPLGPRTLVRATTWDDLLFIPETEGYVHQFWIMARVLNIPLAAFDREHGVLSMEMRERLASVHPEAMVRMYVLGNVVAPLLLWLREYQHVVAHNLQEFLHVVCPDRPQCRVWHWSLLPHTTPLPLVATQFRLAELLPAFRGLEEIVLEAEPGELVPFEELERQGFRLQRDPLRRHMDTAYDPRAEGAVPTALWFAPEVFFYVMRPGQDPNDPFNARPPADHTELPGWVLPALLAAHGRGGGPAARRFVTRNVDAYLATFAPAAGGSPAQQLLRRVNWGALPLVWRPVTLRDVPTCVTVAESAAAQTRLVLNATKHLVDEGAAAVDAAAAHIGALRLLGRVKGVDHDSG